VILKKKKKKSSRSLKAIVKKRRNEVLEDMIGIGLKDTLFNCL